MTGHLAGLPPLATTGVGSLPFSAPRAAVRHAFDAYDVPFCPQLPRLDGDMVAEWLGADPARCGWNAERDRERPAAWTEFVSALAGSRPRHGLVKLQVTGPVTLAIALERLAGRTGSGADVERLAEELAHWLAANVREQIERIADLGLVALVVIDEPGLGGAGIEPGRSRPWAPLSAIAPAWGLHVCGAVPWELVASLEPDLISFDATLHGFTPGSRPVLRRHLRRGGRVAWGVLDPVAPEGAEVATGLAATCVATMTDGELSPGLVAERSLLTPSCGTGRLAPERERMLAARLEACARGVRRGHDALSRKVDGSRRPAHLIATAT